MDREKGIPKEARELRCMYLGLGIDRDGKLYHRWYYLDAYPEIGLPEEIENDGEPLKDRYKLPRQWQFGKVGPAYNVRAGAIVRMKGIIKPDGNSSVWGGTQELLEMWANAEDCTRWQAQVWHDRMQQRTLSEKKQEMTREMHLERLKPFREIYANLPPLEQPLFLANIVSYVTRGTAAIREKK